MSNFGAGILTSGKESILNSFVPLDETSSNRKKFRPYFSG